jgi:hypothetical protein
MAAAAVIAISGSAAHAAVYNLSLTGSVSNFSNSQFTSGSSKYNDFYLPLSGLDSSNAITVSQADTINATVTLDQSYTMAASPQHTDFLLYLFGSSFPSENTGVNGTFSLYNSGTLVGQFGFSSTSSSQLSSYAALFPADNHAYTFDTITDNLTINTLATPATLDGSAFNYDLVSNVPEPSIWATMLMGLGALGAAARRVRRPSLAQISA